MRQTPTWAAIVGTAIYVGVAAIYSSPISFVILGCWLGMHGTANGIAAAIKYLECRKQNRKMTWKIWVDECYNGHTREQIIERDRIWKVYDEMQKQEDKQR